jgi:hypothetical protein
MNIQLVESLLKVIQTLPEAEQSMLKQQLIHPKIAETSPQNQHLSILSPLITAGRIIPPPQQPSDYTISEPEFRAIVNQIQITGSPISETVIEDRGEW